MTLALTYTQALWFLPLALPICLYVAWSDLRDMRIPNKSVLALFGVFAVAGFVVLPADAYLWRLLAMVVVLFVGFGVTSLGFAGAGDSKFAAAMAPFVAPGDYLFFVMLFSLVLIGSWVIHRIAGRVQMVRRATADWVSWEQGKLFPMGVALAGSLVIYLALGLRAGP